MSKQLKTSMTLTQFGKAMSQLDLTNVPKHRHRRAVLDHFMKIQQNEIHDNAIANEIAMARLMSHKLQDMS